MTKAARSLTLHAGAAGGSGVYPEVGGHAEAEVSGRNMAGAVHVFASALGGFGVERGGAARVDAYGHSERDGDRVEVGRESAPVTPRPSGPVVLRDQHAFMSQTVLR